MTSNDPTPGFDFGAFVRRHAERAYNFAYRLVGNEQDARDLVQEAFAHAIGNFGKYDPSRPIEPWFNTILKNISLDGMRKYAHTNTVSLDEPSPVEDVS